MSKQMWGIHMDRSVGSQPIDNGFISIGWRELGDLSAIPPDREAFKAAISTTFPDAKAGSIPVQAGVLYRFVHDLNEGDLVVYPSKADRTINLGRVTGPYQHRPDQMSEYPNCRPVQWLRHIPREDFSQAALYEIGSFISLFRVKGHADEFLSALEGREPRASAQLPDDDEDNADDASVTQAVSYQAEETTQDFIIRQLKTGIDAYQFEEFVAHLLVCMGYFARVTAKSADGGVDVIAHRDELGFEPPIIKVQCKQVTDTVGSPGVQQLMGSIAEGEHALFVTLGGYTKEARAYERSKAALRLLDGPQLVGLIYAHYERFQPRFQALLPLKRIYVASPKLLSGE